MRRFLGWLVHPITMIVAVQIAWTLALVFWILFFLRRYRQIVELARSTGLRTQDLISWAPLVVGILLLVLIFAGTLALILSLARQAIVNRQMRNFLSFVSHELRTPLTSIRLSLETMRDNELDAGQEAEFIEDMIQDTDRLSRQIGGVLDASRLQRRRMPLRRELLDLDHFVQEYAAQRGPSVTSGGHALVVEKAKPVSVMADPDGLRAALDNLVRNAERYSPKGTRISVSVNEDGPWAEIRVRDRGIGIDPRERRKIFKLFFRGASAQSRSGRGSGLGLYIVKGIVGLLGGKVEVQSEGPGKGSTFTIRLRRAGAAEPDEGNGP